MTSQEEIPSINNERSPVSYLRSLYQTEGRGRLVDFFLTLGYKWSEEEEPLTKTEIMEETGLQRKTVIKHIDFLVDVEIVKVTEGGRWQRYAPAIESSNFKSLLMTNCQLAQSQGEEDTE